jgi:DNA-binding Lrp family transcriptional regulator
MTNNKFGLTQLSREEGAGPALKIKNGTVALDATDLKILEALQEDARQTYGDIGKGLGIAHSTVYDRIRRMEHHGIIKQYTTVVDGEKAGVRNITALMTVYTDPKESERVAEELSKKPEVLEVYTSLSEELLIMAKVVAESQEGLHEFIANSVAPLAGVLRIRTSIVTKKFKETPFSITNDADKLHL